MSKIRRILLFPLIIFHFICISSLCFGDETQIFSSAVSPDAMMILDLSGSMNFPPSGSMFYVDDYGSCYANGPFYSSPAPGRNQQCDYSYLFVYYGYPNYSDSTCSSGYYIYQVPGYSTDCSKLAFAKKAIFKILDANGNGTVDPNPASPAGTIGPDQTALGVRLGYMNFYYSYTSLINGINSDYSVIWNSVNGVPWASGGTPLADALTFAKNKLDESKAGDPAVGCRLKFVVLITDGQDTYGCYGNGTDTQMDMYKRRKLTVARAKALADAGYKVFVIGFGSQMPPEQKNTLNWAAYFGGTDNNLQPNSGNTAAITISADPCNEPATNDPGMANLSGYAFQVTNADELITALKNVFIYIQKAAYSFSVTSVAAVRVTDENFLYQASFVPSGVDPFWTGHLEKYNIDSQGNKGSMVWDAGAMLQQQVQMSPRTNILTYVNGAMTKFVPPPDGPGWGTWQGYLGADLSTTKAIMGYIVGDPAYNPDKWELGDIFHSNPIVIGSPSSYFNDFYSPNAFSLFRTQNHSRQRLLLAGANEGQLHGFDTSSGNEVWSFIPPNFLPKLKYLAHMSNSGTLPAHMYFVDGPVVAADVWLGSGDGQSKSKDDWRTLLVFSEGRGVRNSGNTTASYLWSASQYCDGDFDPHWGPLFHKYYCGYWAFDVTDTSATTPTFKWRIKFDASEADNQAPYLGEPWSKMAIGRVRISGIETWVGFIGGGFNNDGGDSNQGRGFFVVRLSDGKVIWSYNRGNDPAMTYSLPAPAAIVDTDNDGFVDTAYIGDLGGNVWRFKFCTGTDGTGCGISNWSGGKFYASSAATPIYTNPSAARSSGDVWVFWGTGNKENPAALGTQDWFFGVKDNNRSSTYTSAQLQDIGGSIFNNSYPGWYMALGSGEKVLADSAVFGGMITWTTYSPYTGINPCNLVGTSNLYSVAMMPIAIGGVTYQVGAGLFATTTGNVVGSRSMALGPGIAQVPIYSQKPGGTGATDAYISISGGGGSNPSIASSTAMAAVGTTPFTQRLQATAPSGQMLHWLDQRMR